MLFSFVEVLRNIIQSLFGFGDGVSFLSSLGVYFDVSLYIMALVFVFFVFYVLWRVVCYVANSIFRR